jgi:hypothetical protein
LDVNSFQISPNSSHVVYIGGPHFDTADIQLRSVPLGGGDSVALSSVVRDEAVRDDFQISSDGSRVVYSVTRCAPPSEQAPFDLYSVPLAVGTATKLATTAEEEQLWFALSPDSSRAVYAIRSGEYPTLKFDFYSIPLTGGASTFLSTTTLYQSSPSFQISPNGNRVVYLAQGQPELHSVPIAGGEAMKLNLPLVNDGDRMETDFQISPDSSQVLYRAKHAVERTVHLYTAPLIGGKITRVNDELSARQGVGGFQITPDSKQVVYRADQDAAFVYELYAAPMGAPQIAFLAPSATVVDTDGSFTLDVQLSAPLEQPATVSYTTGGTAVEGIDYTIGGAATTAATGSLTFAPGETRKSLVVTLIDSPIPQGERTLVLNLASTNMDLGVNASFTLTIIDSQHRVFLPVIMQQSSGQ